MKWEELPPEVQRSWADLRTIIDEGDLVDVIAEFAAQLKAIDDAAPLMAQQMNADDRDRASKTVEAKAKRHR